LSSPDKLIDDSPVAMYDHDSESNSIDNHTSSQRSSSKKDIKEFPCSSGDRLSTEHEIANDFHADLTDNINFQESFNPEHNDSIVKSNKFESPRTKKSKETV